MPNLPSGGGESAAPFAAVYYPIVIKEPEHRRAVTDIATLFPGGHHRLEDQAGDWTLVYESPSARVSASRSIGAAVAHVRVAEGSPRELAAVRVYEEIRHGQHLHFTDVDPTDGHVYTAAPNLLTTLAALAQRAGSEAVVEFVGAPGATYDDVSRVLATAYTKPSALEGAQAVLHGLQQLSPPLEEQ